MRKTIKIISIGLISLISLLVIIYIIFQIKWNIESSMNMSNLGPEAPIIDIDGRSFRDLNKNGKLDVYEDTTKDIDKRIEDLISQMSIEEKAGSMFITVIGINEDGSLSENPTFSNVFSFLFPSSSKMLVNLKMNHFNIMATHKKENMLKWYNNIQKIGERSRLGIPITIASDPRHGVSKSPVSSNTSFFSKWPSALGLGAIGDSSIVREHANIVRQEYSAIGIKLALGPMADVSTEPRWIRVNGTFGEDANLNSKLTSAYIKGLQGDSLNVNSVASMVKHFPGSGPVDDGKDTHFPPGLQSYKGGNFEYHLIPFKAAFDAGVSSVMPYYSLPLGITSEDVGGSYNKEIITGLLRERYKFDGIICTDWKTITDVKLPFGIIFKPASAFGVENLNIKERIIKKFSAGIDMFGGETLSIELSELIRDGKISEYRIDQSLRRIYKQKFNLGLFDNPYIHKESLKIFSNLQNIEKGIEAQKKSLILLKNEDNFLPLKNKKKIHYYGFENNFIKKISQESIENSDLIIMKLKSPKGRFKAKYIMEKLFGGGPLDFSSKELSELIPLIKSKPTIVIINLERPAIIKEISKEARAVIADFNSSNEIIMDLIKGKFNPTGKLPIELPSSMEAVNNQIEDIPYDSKEPLFKFGHGLTYD
ncbi:MAG: glycoside hydrolase family 3 N-terminal domain-containing protein [Flavobacteriaceae bacterium]